MSVTSSHSGAEITIKIHETLALDDSAEFSKIYKSVDNSQVSFIIDMEETDYLDSSGLGLLLKMKHRVGGEKERIRITNCKPFLKKLFQISHYHDLFSID